MVPRGMAHLLEVVVLPAARTHFWHVTARVYARRSSP